MIKTAIPWLEGLDLSANYFDGEHHALLERLNSLHSAIAAQDRDRILDFTRALHSVAEAHFENEEKQMREARYRATESHRASHKKLLDALDRFYEETSQMHDMTGIQVASSFLKEWFGPHLKNDDKLFSEFLAALRYMGKVQPL